MADERLLEHHVAVVAVREFPRVKCDVRERKSLVIKPPL